MEKRTWAKAWRTRKPGVLRHSRELICWGSEDSEVAIASEEMSGEEAFSSMVAGRTPWEGTAWETVRQCLSGINSAWKWGGCGGQGKAMFRKYSTLSWNPSTWKIGYIYREFSTRNTHTHHPPTHTRTRTHPTRNFFGKEIDNDFLT